MSVPFRLGIDFGASTTVAFLHRPEGPTEPLSFDGTPVLPSAGLGVEEPLRRVLAEAQRVAGQPVTSATLAHPVGWDESQRGQLHRAALRAGLSTAWLVPAPVAATAFHLRRHPALVRGSGATVVVFDLGVDASVIRYEAGAGPAAYRVLASAGLSGGSEAVAVARDLVARAGLAGPPDAVLLIGRAVAASLMPVVAGRLQPALGVAPTVVDQPELVVAAGSLDVPVAAPVTVSYTALPSLRPAVDPSRLPPYAGPPFPGPPFPGPPFPVFAGPPPHLAGQHPAGQHPAGQHPAGPYVAGPYVAGPYVAGPHFAGPAPHAAGPGGAVPVVGVEAIALSLPSSEGITLRGQLRPGYDIVEYIFPEVDGALPLYRDGNAMLREAAAFPGDPLYAATSWRTSAIGDDRRFDLTFVPEHLADGPERWFPEYLTRCRDISAQLAIFFELADVEELLKEGSLLDTLDETLRRADGAVLGWKYRRQLARLDKGEVIRQWHTIVDAIDRVVRLHD